MLARRRSAAGQGVRDEPRLAGLLLEGYPARALGPDDGRLIVSSPTQGASIEYRIDGGRWRLYTEPLDAAPDARVAARAVRYGFAQSETRNFE